ncbi:MAG TPA: glycosyltransferase family 4 protein [Gemmataceae bacterium]|nr:glycosyltransferase family 4 protein [Gemmataceae bacterium]
MNLADRTTPGFVVAILDWSHLIEDFLDNVGVSLDAFCRELTGGWMFGYVEALQRAGCRAVVVCVSDRVKELTAFRHEPTGATIYLLPAPAAYRAARRKIPNPYATNLEEAAGDVRGGSLAWYAVLREVLPYLTTPLKSLAKVLRREGCRAILCQEYENPRFDACVLLGRLLGLPVFATFQGGDWQLSRLERWVRPLTVRGCSGLVVATATEARRLRARYRVPEAKLARVFNPLDVGGWPREDKAEARASLSVPTGARVAAWHGRVLMHRKGLDVLLDAWERVTAERPGADYRLLLLGTGNDAAELRRRLAADRPRRVVWRDQYVNDRAFIRQFLAAADVYVFPSRHEGFPVAPVEAMAAGLPVIAGDAPGAADILAGGEAVGGILVPVGDVRALATALATLLDDPARCQALGRCARERAERAFSLEAVGEQLRDFLSRVPAA